MTTRLTRLALVIPAILLFVIAGCTGGIVTEPGYYLGHPEDITPPDLNTGEGYALINQSTEDMAAKDGYLYLAGDDLLVVDVDPPRTAHLASTIFTAGSPRYVEIDGNYLYVGDGGNGLMIFDITSPENPDLITTLPIPFSPGGMVIENGYAYLGGLELNIYDIDPPQSGHQVGQIDFAPLRVYSLDVENGYAYVFSGYMEPGLEHLSIVDVDPPESAEVVGGIDLDHNARIAVHNGLAYLAHGRGLDIYNVEPPDSIQLIKSVVFDGDWNAPVLSRGYAYIPDWDSGFYIVDADPPIDAHPVWKTELPYGTDCLDVVDNYIYVMNGPLGLRIYRF